MIDFRLYVLGVCFGLVLFAGLGFWSYLDEQRDLQQPIVQTCVQHRVNKKVLVQQ